MIVTRHSSITRGFSTFIRGPRDLDQNNLRETLELPERDIRRVLEIGIRNLIIEIKSKK